MKFKCLTSSNISQFSVPCIAYSKSSNCWNDDVESDAATKNSLRGRSNSECDENCRLRILLKSAELQGLAETESNNRDKWDALLTGDDDLFVPIHTSTHAAFEKNDWTASHRGRRQMTRKNFVRTNFDPFITIKRAYLMPLRVIRQRKIDDAAPPQHDKRVIIPKSHTLLRYPSDLWLFKNINSDDRSMIDRLGDLNQPEIEVRNKKSR
jgi:hypothetical protein